MKNQTKAQITIEVIMSVLLLLLLFVAIIFFITQKNIELDFITTDYENQVVCEKVAGIITHIYSNSETTQITISIKKDINITATTVNIDNYFCRFSGTAIPTNLAKGDVNIFDENGIVRLVNV